jgi:hypothetical protein
MGKKTQHLSLPPEIPDWGAVTTKILEYFDRALAGRAALREQIRHYEAESCLTIDDMLMLAWLRNELALVDPPLSDGPYPPAAKLWVYGMNHTEELLKIQSLREELNSYLGRENADDSTEMANLLRGNDLAFLALWPIVSDPPGKVGHPPTRRRVAARALQMKKAGNRTWPQIAEAICDCRQKDHTKYCTQNIRQGVIRLQKLLRVLGFDPER